MIGTSPDAHAATPSPRRRLRCLTSLGVTAALALALAGPATAASQATASSTTTTLGANLLHSDFATLEKRAVGGGLTNTTLTWDATRAHTGSRSLKVTAKAAGDTLAYVGETSTAVAPGATVELSAWVYNAASTARTVRMAIDWKTANGGSYVSSQSTAALSVPAGSWTLVSAPLVVPARATIGTLFLGGRALALGDAVHWDDLAVQTRTTTSAPAPAPAPTTAPVETGPNLLSTESSTMETRAVGGALTNTTVTWDATRAHTGTRSLKATAVAAGSTLAYVSELAGPATSGGTAVLSAWVYVDNTEGTARSVRLAVDWKTAPGGVYVTSSSTQEVSVGARGWTSVSAPLAVPAGATSGMLFVGAKANAAGEAVHWDDLAVRMVSGTTSPPTTAPTTPPPTTGTGPLRLVPVDGGAGYYGKFPNSLPSDPSYFPLGVWLESVHEKADVDKDKAAGLNLYNGLTANSDLSVLAANGMRVLPQEEWFSRPVKPSSPAVAGWLLGDEVDMFDGPVKGLVTMQSRFDAVKADGRMKYSNYGKGVMFWETDEEAGRFVNDYQDVVSNDIYWYTDPAVCGQWEGGKLLNGATRALTEDECRRASNYGATVKRMRALVSPARSKPVWNFVEVGHPFTEEWAPTITPAQTKAAVWSSIINGARGIMYFNHSFAGSCTSHHVLREPCAAPVRAAVTEVNGHVTALAPVLNAATVEGLVTTTSKVETMTKFSGGKFYVFTGPTTNAPQTAVLRADCVGNATATVLHENRTVPVVNGVITDSFANGTTNHIYRIDGGSTCGL